MGWGHMQFLIYDAKGMQLCHAGPSPKKQFVDYEKAESYYKEFENEIISIYAVKIDPSKTPVESDSPYLIFIGEESNGEDDLIIPLDAMDWKGNRQAEGAVIQVPCVAAGITGRARTA